MMHERKVMLKYEHTLLDDPENEIGVCSCGYELEPGEIVMGYPCDEEAHAFVCLTCHFWYVQDEESE